MQRAVKQVLWSTVLGVSLALSACKGDKSNGTTGPTPPAPPTSPVVTGAPTAVFAAVASANAFDPVTFDATASTSTDGSALQYAWDFGDGQRGGGKTIARSFPTGGARTVTLTVFDGANRSGTTSRSITIAAPTAPVSSLSVQGAVKGLDGTAISGVQVSQVGGTATASTDTAGKARLTLGIGSPLMLKFSKAGLADQFLAITLPATTGADAYVDVVMRTRDAALTLGDAAAGGSLSGRDGAVLTLPAAALVTAAGTAVTGAVQVAITPVDPTQLGGGGFPGGFAGITQTGTTTPIVSFGTTEYVLTSGGQGVQVAPGKSATIELPLYGSKRLNGTLLVVGDTTPLWSLDERTGGWVQEGSGSVVASTNSPSGLALRATVTHFSWWNSDIGFDPYGPQPKCVYDTDIGVPGANDTFASATICNMLAQIDSSGGGPAPRVTSRTTAPAPALRTVATAARVLPPRIAGFAVRRALPIAGGVTVPVPANLPVRLTATALNGTWGGSLVVNGPVGVQAEAVIKMRPLFTTAGAAPEAITLPFDGTRSLVALQPTALFTFTGVASQFARVRISQANGSILSGRVRLLQGTTVLGSSQIVSSTAQVIAAIPANGTYTVEVVGDAAAAFRLQVDLLGGVTDEPIALPLDITRTVAQYFTFRGALAVSAATTIFVARLTVGGAADIRVLSPSGAVLLDGTLLPDTTRGATVTLPAAGTYTLEIKPRSVGGSTIAHVTLNQTLWTQVGPAIENGGVSGGTFSLVDAQTDRNGKVVVGYTETVGTTNRFKLLRWSGTAWEAAAADLTIDKPCTGSGNAMNFTFDNTNRPVVLYGNRSDPSTATFVTAQRYSGGTWQPLGPNNGTLPITSAFGGACTSFPAVAVGADDLPLAAYQSDNNIVVQRFDGTQWKGLATPATGDVFALQNGTYDLKVDATGRAWFVTGSPGFSGIAALVRRFNTTTLAWETIGGSLPQIGTVGLQTPRLRFDAAGQPVVAWVASVGSGGVATSGTAVYRYDGTTWSTTGGFKPAESFLQAGANDLGFALFNGEALVSWTATRPSIGNGVVVQRSSPTGWTPVGAGGGEVPQYTIGGVNDAESYYSKLVPSGGELFMAVLTSQPKGVTTVRRVVLLRKVP